MHRRPTSHRVGPRPRLRSQAPKPRVSTQAKLTWGISFAVVTIALIWLIWPVFSMLAASAAFAYILDPIIDRWEAQGRSRNSGIVLLYVVATLVFTLLLLILIPAVAGQFAELSQNIAGYITNIEKLALLGAAWVETNLGFHIPIDLSELKTELSKGLKEVSPDAVGTVRNAVRGLFTSSLGFILNVFNLVLLPVFTFFLLSDWDRIIKGVDDLVPPRYRPRVRGIAKEVDLRLTGFVQGQITVALVLAVLYSGFLFIFRIDLAFVVGITSGILFIVPYLGTVVGLVLASVLSLLKYGLDWHLIGVAVAFGVPQLFEGYVLTPKIMGDKVGLHPMVIMVSLLVGGSLVGIWGMLLAIPITAVLSVLGAEWLKTYRGSRVFSEDE